MKSLEYLYSRNWLERGYISSNYNVELSSKISRISQYKNIQETQISKISKYRKSRKYKYPKYPPTRKSWEYKYSRNWLYRGFLEIKISKYQEIQETQISRISADKEICGIQIFEIIYYIWVFWKYKYLEYRISFRLTHCDLKVSRSHAKIYENFANYFLKTKANNKYFIVLKCTCKELQKSISKLER